jgi:hypothetical protein
MDNFTEFKEGIEIELINLGRLSNEATRLLLETGDERSSVEIRAAGSILHDFYCGVEKIFELLAVNLEGELPVGLNWHTQLLIQMGKPAKGTRNSLISDQSMDRLKKYLRFRHLFRNIYGFELNWERIEPLLVDLKDVLSDFDKEVKEFLSTLT